MMETRTDRTRNMRWSDVDRKMDHFICFRSAKTKTIPTTMAKSTKGKTMRRGSMRMTTAEITRVITMRNMKGTMMSRRVRVGMRTIMITITRRTSRKMRRMREVMITVITIMTMRTPSMRKILPKVKPRLSILALAAAAVAMGRLLIQQVKLNVWMELKRPQKSS